MYRSRSRESRYNIQYNSKYQYPVPVVYRLPIGRRCLALFIVILVMYARSYLFEVTGPTVAVVLFFTVTISSLSKNSRQFDKIIYAAHIVRMSLIYLIFQLQPSMKRNLPRDCRKTKDARQRQLLVPWPTVSRPRPGQWRRPAAGRIFCFLVPCRSCSWAVFGHCRPTVL